MSIALKNCALSWHGDPLWSLACGTYLFLFAVKRSSRAWLVPVTGTVLTPTTVVMPVGRERMLDPIFHRSQVGSQRGVSWDSLPQGNTGKCMDGR